MEKWYIIIDDLWKQLNHYKNILLNSDSRYYRDYNIKNVKQIIKELENEINNLCDIK
jgi:hypothetical protein